jgi:CubicO group peptidase (beta-lactamase class C family)
MKLVEEGKLSLDDPIGKHLKPFEGRRITLRDLLHHSSGLPSSSLGWRTRADRVEKTWRGATMAA